MASDREVHSALSYLIGHAVDVKSEILGKYNFQEFTGDDNIDRSTGVGVDGEYMGSVVWTITYDKYMGHAHLLQALPACQSNQDNSSYPSATAYQSNVMSPTEAYSRDDHMSTSCGHQVSVLRRQSGYSSLTGDIELQLWNHA